MQRLFKPVTTTLLALSLLLGCGHGNRIVLDRSNDGLPPDQVDVYLNREPACEFAVVALLQADGGYPTRARVVEVFRQQAADLGANAVQIHYLQKIGASEFMGAGRAIRCDDAAAL